VISHSKPGPSFFMGWSTCTTREIPLISYLENGTTCTREPLKIKVISAKFG